MGAPAADTVENDNSGGGCDGKPGDTALAERKNDKCGEQRADGATGVASNLKEGLRKSVLAAGGNSRDARGLGMKDGRTRTDDRRGNQQQSESGYDGEQDDARQRKAHAEGQREGNGAAIGKHADKGLQKTGDNLVSEGEQADLAEIE